MPSPPIAQRWFMAAVSSSSGKEWITGTEFEPITADAVAKLLASEGADTIVAIGGAASTAETAFPHALACATTLRRTYGLDKTTGTPVYAVRRYPDADSIAALSSRPMSKLSEHRTCSAESLHVVVLDVGALEDNMRGSSSDAEVGTFYCCPRRPDGLALGPDEPFAGEA
ncbi:hypothetical protein Q5752_003452 [Cryptotrichosporon argae]